MTILQTKRLKLVPFHAGMVTETHVSWLNDLKVTRYSEQRHRKHTLESQHNYLNSFPAGSHVWLIQSASKDVGTITAYVDTHNKVADMGIMIGDRLSLNIGYASEAWAVVMKYLFSVEGVRKITAGCMVSNTAMQRLAVKSGMSFESVSKDQFLLNRKSEDLIRFAAFRAQARPSEEAAKRVG